MSKEEQSQHEQQLKESPTKEENNEQAIIDEKNDEYEDVVDEKNEMMKKKPKWLTTRVEDSISMQITMKPIAVFKSCFSRKNGTPRQGAIAPHSKGYLKLIPENCFGKLVSHHALINLTDFSHIWIIYYFHDNRKNFTMKKPKARPPRLNGGAVGLFATRSPHVRVAYFCHSQN